MSKTSSTEKYLETQNAELQVLCAWLINKASKEHREYARNEFEQITGIEIDDKGRLNWREAEVFKKKWK